MLLRRLALTQSYLVYERQPQKTWAAYQYIYTQMDEGYMRACMCVWRRCVCVRESIHPRGVSVISRGQKERAKDKVSARQRWMERGGEKESEEGERHREK